MNRNWPINKRWWNLLTAVEIIVINVIKYAMIQKEENNIIRGKV